MLPSVVNLFRYIMALEHILTVNPLQLAPAQTAPACSLSYGAEQDVAEAEMINTSFLSFTRWILPDEQPSFTQTTNKKIRQRRTFPFELTRNRLAIIGRSRAQTCNEALVGYLPETAVWLDRKWLRKDQSQSGAAAALTPADYKGPRCVQGLFTNSIPTGV